MMNLPFRKPAFLVAAALLFWFNMASADELGDAINELQHAWAKGNYTVPTKQKEQYFAALQAKARKVTKRFPGRAEPLIWEGIITSSRASFQNFMHAAQTAKVARDLLMAAEKIDPGALDGSALTTLGSLYYKVPQGISFGNRDKARSYLKRALAINPDGIDPNYFFGELMAKEGDNAKAIAYLKKALAAPQRPGHEDEDAGRRAEAKGLLDQLSQ